MIIKKWKLAILLLLHLTVRCLAIAPPTNIRCSESITSICMNSTNLRISQVSNHYRLDLCIDNRCISGTQEMQIECHQLCDACKSISSASQCMRQHQCERRVSIFLHDYCTRNTLSTHTVTITTAITHTPVIRYRPVTKTVTLSPSCTLSAEGKQTQNSMFSSSSSSIPITKLATKLGEQASTTNEHSTILGVFLCLLVIALVVVSIGWILTLWRMKKKLSQKASVINVKNNDKPDLYFNNPTYGETLIRQLPIHQSEATYESVSQPPSKQALEVPESGQSYDKLNHKRQVTGNNTFTDGNYSKLGIQDKDNKNNSHLASQNGEEEIDDEHDYFVLEGPESEDQNETSGYMAAEIMGGATDYEVPVQLKKSKQ